MSLDHISHIPVHVLVSTMKFTTEYRNKIRYLTLNQIEYNSSIYIFCNLFPSWRQSSRQLFSTILFYHYRHNFNVFKIMYGKIAYTCIFSFLHNWHPNIVCRQKSFITLPHEKILLQINCSHIDSGRQA